MVERDLRSRLQAAAGTFPAVTVTGPRQSGKSTLCRTVFDRHPYANLEAPDVRAFATADPRAFLAQFPSGAVIDEIQRCPDLASYLQVLIDEVPAPGRWILTGSQSLNLLESVSQSLAGRTQVLHLLPLARNEIRRFTTYPRTLDETLLTGGYPRIYDQHIDPSEWLGAYIGTYVERDVRLVSNVGDLTTFQWFVQLCAARTGQLLNLSSLSSDCGISQPTAKAWLSVLETTFVAFRLPPYIGNLSKRVVRAPKLHFYDSGLVCWLLGIRNVEQLRLHPLRGLIFETWVVSEIVKHRYSRGEHRGLFFYRDRQGNESDLVIEGGGKLTVVEVKAGQTVTDDLVKAGRRGALALAEAHDVESIIVYGGDAPQKRTDVELIPWDSLDRRSW